MNEDEKMNEDLENYEKIINEKIEIVRELLHEEDKAVVDEIIMKKNHSTDPSTSLSKPSLPQVRQEDLLLPGVLEGVSPQRNHDLQNQRLFPHKQTNRL
jgi:hypothetical protein